MACSAVGIDLGTTNSCVAVYKSGRVEIISNSYSNRMTPSCVAFTDECTLVGEAAKDQQANNPANTVFAIKRLIGRRFSEACVQEDLKNWPFKVTAGADDEPQIQVQHMGVTKLYTPEEISSMVLGHMKTVAETYLCHPVTDAVITVPANYGDAQRQAVCKAAQLSGLNVLRLINEPTAAALAYGFENVPGIVADRHILVFDLGGGTLDVSILLVGRETLFEVKAAAGDMHLGGDDFDNLLVAHFVEEFKRKHKMNLMENPKAIRRLSAVCERTKRALTGNTFSAVEIDCLHKGYDYYGKLPRSEFENICGNLFRKTLQSVEEALQIANLRKENIDEVVLTGGSARIPKIQQILQAFFSGKRLNTTVNPDEAVAYGAAVLAAKMSGTKSANVDRMKFVDITSFSLNFENPDGRWRIQIPRGSQIPVKVVTQWTTSSDYQTSSLVRIFEGEQPKAKDNYFVGGFRLTGYPAKLKGEIEFEQTMEIDENGILHVTAVEVSTGIKNEISFSRRVNSRLFKVKR